MWASHTVPPPASARQVLQPVDKRAAVGAIAGQVPAQGSGGGDGMVTCREVASVQRRAEAPAHGRGGEEWLPACRMRCLLLCGPRTLHSIRLSQGLREEGGGSPAFQLVLELGDGHVLQAASEQGKF